MPMGIIINVIATATGAILGDLFGKKISEAWKTLLNNVFGVCAMTIGIVLIQRMENLSAVILALLAGVILGKGLDLEGRINAGANMLTQKLMGGAMDDGSLARFSAAVVLFAFSGTSWYGALTEGLTGDGSILIAKAILDGPTAFIFAAILGKVILMLCVPQAAVYAILFLLSGLVAPLITPSMFADFSAVGGVITLVAGLRVAGIKQDIPVLDMLPGLLLVFFTSAFWTTFIA